MLSYAVERCWWWTAFQTSQKSIGSCAIIESIFCSNFSIQKVLQWSRCVAFPGTQPRHRWFAISSGTSFSNGIIPNPPLSRLFHIGEQSRACSGWSDHWPIRIFPLPPASTETPQLFQLSAGLKCIVGWVLPVHGVGFRIGSWWRRTWDWSATWSLWTRFGVDYCEANWQTIPSSPHC